MLVALNYKVVEGYRMLPEDFKDQQTMFSSLAFLIDLPGSLVKIQKMKRIK
jgi:hypothetical protein